MNTSTVIPISIGDVVRYYDEFGKEHAALVTAVHGKFYESDTWTQEDLDADYAEYASKVPEDKRIPQDRYSPAHLLGTHHTVPSVNLVCVDGDEEKYDSYGRQIFRPTSVVHRDVQSARGRFWENFLV